jgi:transcriptional regulator with XRE-family HTH domain
VELRIAGDFSERGLAAAAGLGTTTVRNLLAGKAEPRLSTMLALAKALELHSIEELLGPMPSEAFGQL